MLGSVAPQVAQKVAQGSPSKTIALGSPVMPETATADRSLDLARKKETGINVVCKTAWRLESANSLVYRVVDVLACARSREEPSRL
jgi:hypothetical protein